MCMIDWKVMRLARSVNHPGSCTNVAPVIIPANPQRIALFLPSDFGGNLVAAIGRTPTSTDYDICLSTVQPEIFTLLNSGDFCQKSFVLICPSAGQANASWTEVVLPEAMLEVELSKALRG